MQANWYAEEFKVEAPSLSEYFFDIILLAYSFYANLCLFYFLFKHFFHFAVMVKSYNQLYGTIYNNHSERLGVQRNKLISLKIQSRIYNNCGRLPGITS